MERIPTWFRWSLIVAASLILCACRSQWQQAPTPPVGKTDLEVVADELSVLRESFVTESDRRQANARQGVVESLQNARQIAEQTAVDIATQAPGQLRVEADSPGTGIGKASPLVAIEGMKIPNAANAASMRRQFVRTPSQAPIVESKKIASSPATLANENSSSHVAAIVEGRNPHGPRPIEGGDSPSQSPVYLHIDGEANESETIRVAQQVEEGLAPIIDQRVPSSVGSPFLDDPLPEGTRFPEVMGQSEPDAGSPNYEVPSEPDQDEATVAPRSVIKAKPHNVEPYGNPVGVEVPVDGSPTESLPGVAGQIYREQNSVELAPLLSTPIYDETPTMIPPVPTRGGSPGTMVNDPYEPYADSYSHTETAPYAAAPMPPNSLTMDGAAVDCTTLPANAGELPGATLGQSITGSITGTAIMGHHPGFAFHMSQPYCLPGRLPGTPLGMAESVIVPGNPVALYPDEYLCDGGDGLFRVDVANNWALRGLEPEDTIGHFDTLDGRVVVEASNSVCIYAPRFAATRQVSSPFTSEKRVSVVSAEMPVLAATDNVRQGPDQFSQNETAQRHVRIQPASTFRHRLPGIESSQGLGLIVLDKDLPPHEDLRVIKFGVHKQSEKPRLAEYVAKAITWSHDAAVQIVVDETIALTRIYREGVEEIFTLEKRGAPKLRVIKTASVDDALPGEEVEFSLRFDNVGFQVIGNVTIVDNLTTRLEYVADSASCTLDAEFSTDENDVESLVLRWEIDQPIAPGKGGLIRFRCRVR